jgi:hypothetical protein
MCMQPNVSTYINKSVVPKILCPHTHVDYRKNLIKSPKLSI